MSPGGIDEQRQGGAELSRADGRGRTPLIHAARSGSPGAVRLLLACGSPVGRQDNKGRTALMYAARAGSMAAVMLLLDAGEPLQERDACGRSALAFAVESCSEAVVQLLVDSGAATEVTDKAGRDLVSIAAKAGAYGPLRLLLDLAQRRTATRANTGKVSRQAPMPLPVSVPRSISAEGSRVLHSPAPGRGRSPSVSTSNEGSTCEAAGSQSATLQAHRRSPSLSSYARSASGGTRSRNTAAFTGSPPESEESLEFTNASLGPPTSQVRPRSLSFDNDTLGSAVKPDATSPLPQSAPDLADQPRDAADTSSDEDEDEPRPAANWTAEGDRLMMPPRWTPARNGFPVSPAGSAGTPWVASSVHKHMVTASGSVVSPNRPRMDHNHITPGLLKFNVMDNPLMDDTPGSELAAAQQGWNGMMTDVQQGKDTVPKAPTSAHKTPYWKNATDSPGAYSQDLVSTDMMMAALASPAIRSEVFKVITNTPHLKSAVRMESGAASGNPKSARREMLTNEDTDAPVQITGLFSSAKKGLRPAPTPSAGKTFASEVAKQVGAQKQPTAPNTGQRSISCPPPEVPFSPGAQLWNQMLAVSDDNSEDDLQLLDAPPELPSKKLAEPGLRALASGLKSPLKPANAPIPTQHNEEIKRIEILATVNQLLLPHQVVSSGLSKQDFQRIAAEVTEVVMRQHVQGEAAGSSLTLSKAARRRIEDVVDKHVERAAASTRREGAFLASASRQASAV
eukprot:jgi/Tetstr1/431718/TSEL_021243.t2